MSKFVSWFGWNVTGEIVEYYTSPSGQRIMSIKATGGEIFDVPVALMTVEA